MNHKLVLWFSLWLLFMQASASETKFKTQTKYEKYTKPLTAIVLPVIKRKVPSIAERITAIILRYLYPRLSTSHFLTHFQDEDIDHLLPSPNTWFLFIGGCQKAPKADTLSNCVYTLKVWDLEKNECVRKFTFFTGNVRDPLFRSFPTYLSLSTHSKGEMLLLLQYDEYKPNVFESRWNADADRYVEANFEELVNWDKSNKPWNTLLSRSIRGSKDIPAFEKYSGMHTKFLTVTQDQQWLISYINGMPSKIHVWNFTTGHLQQTRDVDDSILSELEEHSITVGTNWIAFGWFVTSMFEIYSVPQLVSLCKIHCCDDMLVTSCAHVQDPITHTYMFALGGYNGNIELWACVSDFTRAERTHIIIQASTRSVNTCCFIMNGNQLLSAGEDTNLMSGSHTAIIKIWDVTTGALIENDKDE